jgi:Na+/H+-dicarboxylate symporter
MKLFEAWANIKTYYTRGFVYFGMISTVAIMLLTIKSFYDTLASLGVPMLLLYAGAAFIVLVVPALLGWFDLHYISEHELKLTWERTRRANRMTEQVESIYNILCVDDLK